MKFTQSKINSFRPPAGKREHELIDDALPGFGIRWRGNPRTGEYGGGVYFAKTKTGVKHSRVSLGKISKVPLSDAQRGAREVFSMAARRLVPGVERRKATARINDTIAGRIDDFVAYLDGKERTAKHCDAARRAFEKYLTALLPFSPFDIDRSMIAKELERIEIESGASTAGHVRSHLSTFFAWLMAKKGVPLISNPVDGTDAVTRKPRTRLLQPDEVRAIFGALLPPGDDYSDVVRLLFLCGLRRAEAAGLVRAEINLGAAQIELPADRTKSRRPYIQPLSSQALAVLTPRASRTGLVFGSGKNVFSAWGLRKEELDARSGVRDWVLHDARRWLVTRMVEELAVEPWVADGCIGHHVGGVVARTYNVGTYLGPRRAALERYGAWLEELLAAKA